MKTDKTSKYKGVYRRKSSTSTNAKEWVSEYRGERSYHEEEKAAAKAYDFKRIRSGEEPVNILKRVAQ